MRLLTRFGLVAVLAVSFAACDSGDPVAPEPVDVDPTFEIASQVVTFNDGSQGL